MNWADFKLYDHFQRRLEQEIDQIGRQKVAEVAREIESRSKSFGDECIYSGPFDTPEEMNVGSG